MDYEEMNDKQRLAVDTPCKFCNNSDMKISKCEEPKSINPENNWYVYCYVCGAIGRPS